jgi:hypothetical protein
MIIVSFRLVRILPFRTLKAHLILSIEAIRIRRHDCTHICIISIVIAGETVVEISIDLGKRCVEVISISGIGFD